MTNEPEWKDANPQIDNLPDKGRSIIMFIAGGLILGIITILGMRIRPLGLGVGSIAFFYGIQMLARRRRFNIKTSIIVTTAGFLLLLANPRFGIVAGFAAFFCVLGAIGLVMMGLIRAIKLAWDLGRGS